MFPGLGNFDPSKLSPQTIAEMSALMQTLTPDQMKKMQSLMHNSMAGFDITKEMLEFEKSLPGSFREKMARIMYLANGVDVPPLNANSAAVDAPVAAPSHPQEARLTILKSVAGGFLSPEEALKVLFPQPD